MQRKIPRGAQYIHKRGEEWERNPLNEGLRVEEEREGQGVKRENSTQGKRGEKKKE